MDKNLKYTMCGCSISLTLSGTLYCFTEKYCKGCGVKLEEQKHIIENIIPTNNRQFYVTGASGTTVAIDTSTNYFGYIER